MGGGPRLLGGTECPLAWGFEVVDRRDVDGR